MSPGSELRREAGVDAYRGLSVVLMYIVHARRLEPRGSWEGAQRGAETVLSWLMWSEPFIAASFLFIVGFSLVLSRERTRDPGRWRRRLLRRALGLYGLAVLLFVLHYGFALPDLLVSPDILSVIAIAIATVAVTLTTSRPVVATLGLTGVTLAVTAACELFDVSLPGLNAGPGGALPLVAFTSAGALLATAQRRWSRRALDVAVAAAVVPLIIVLLLGVPWTRLHVSLHPDYAGEVAIAEIFTVPEARVRLLFWNHTVAGWFGLLLPLAAVLRLLVAAESWLQRAPASLLGLIGRHALAAYVGHLIALGLLDLVGRGPQNPVQTWLLVAALVTAAASASAGREAWKRRPTTAPDRGTVHAADRRR